MKKFFGVVYLTNGDACVGSPCDTEEECVAELEKAVRKHARLVKATTYMVRECDDTMALFGKPKSRDLMQNKKFVATL